jgi:hypothetical protein
VKLNLGRIVVLSLVGIVTTTLFASCASSEEGVFDTGGNGDASQDGDPSFGGIGGSTGGVSNFGGVGATGTGGAFPSTGGGSGTGTGGAAVGGGAGMGTGGTPPGTCNPAFCPNTGVGTPCCVNPNGPCGMNNGSGCSNVAADF